VAQLTEAEGVLHDGAIGDADRRVARAGHVEQVAMRALADHPEWDAAVLAALPAAHRSAAVDDAAAGRDLRSLVRTPKASLPAWTIVEPAPADELRRYYQEGEARFGVPWQYLAAVHLTETKMGRLRGTSTAGARGPMQFLPSTWAAYGGGGDIDSNHDAILGAARYLAANGGGRGDLHNALFRYNPTEKYVRAVTRYAERMKADPMAYRGYWGWQVYYWSTLGDVWLRPGWSLAQARPVTPADLG
jgi:membrane-bound lytic murein transglycosylase B